MIDATPKQADEAYQESVFKRKSTVFVPEKAAEKKPMLVEEKLSLPSAKP